MENLPVTEQTLSKIKDEILVSVQVAMAEENKKRDQKLDQICHALINSYQTSASEMRSAIIQLGTRIQGSGNSVKTTAVPVQSEIADSNIVRLLSTFENAMENAGKKLAESNETEVGKYIRILSEQFSNITDTMAEKLGLSFNSGVNQLGNTLEDFIGNMTDKNRISLQEVQRENNLELQKLSDSLTALTQENREFSESSSRSGQTLTDNMNRLIENSENLDDTIHKHIINSASEIEKAMQRQIEQLLETMAEHEKHNADEFKKSMEDYRQEFVKASAEAIANVQSDMLTRMEETQKQMAALSATFENYLAAAKDHELKSQQQNDTLFNTLSENSNNLSKNINDVMCNIDLTFSEIQTYVNEDMTKNINEFMGEFEDRVKNILSEYNSKIKDLGVKINDVLDIIDNLNKQVKENTDNYQKTLKQVSESQRHAQELSKNDMLLLQEMIKKI